MDHLSTIVSMVSTLVAATWFLSRKLGSIESAIKGHVELDNMRFESINRRIDEAQMAASAAKGNRRARR